MGTWGWHSWVLHLLGCMKDRSSATVYDLWHPKCLHNIQIESEIKHKVSIMENAASRFKHLPGPHWLLLWRGVYVAGDTPPPTLTEAKHLSLRKKMQYKGVPLHLSFLWDSCTVDIWWRPYIRSFLIFIVKWHMNWLPTTLLKQRIA